MSKYKDFIFRIQQETHQNPVEQQTVGGALQPDHSLWVINKTDMIWDADDIWKFYGSGQLDSGETTSISKKVICDWKNHMCGISCYFRRGEYKVSISISGPHISHSITGKKCLMITPDYVRSLGDFVPIEGSNGGVGQIYEVEFSVKNLGRKSDFSVMGEIAHLSTTRQSLYSTCPWTVTKYGQSMGFNPKISWAID